VCIVSRNDKTGIFTSSSEIWRSFNLISIFSLFCHPFFFDMILAYFMKAVNIPTDWPNNTNRNKKFFENEAKWIRTREKLFTVASKIRINCCQRMRVNRKALKLKLKSFYGLKNVPSLQAMFINNSQLGKKKSSAIINH
jgi:hypothetical protein